MPAKKISAEKIVDTTIALAEVSSWHDIHLYQVAQHLKIDLLDIKKHFKSKGAVGSVLFDRADEAMIKESQSDIFKKLSDERKLHHLIIAWINYLSEHKKVSKEILKSKFCNGTCHAPFCMMVRLKLTGQWMLEAMHRGKIHHHPILEQKAITGILLETLTYWYFDTSKDHHKTYQHLEKTLSRGKFTCNLASYWLNIPFVKTMREKACRQHKSS